MQIKRTCMSLLWLVIGFHVCLLLLLLFDFYVMANDEKQNDWAQVFELISCWNIKITRTVWGLWDELKCFFSCICLRISFGLQGNGTFNPFLPTPTPSLSYHVSLFLFAESAASTTLLCWEEELQRNGSGDGGYLFLCFNLSSWVFSLLLMYKVDR